MTEEIFKKIEEDVATCSKSNQKRRREKLLEYYSNPNYCKHCGKLIEIPFKGKPSETKIKLFCDRSCAVSYNNKKEPKKKKIIKEKEEKVFLADSYTKKEIFEKYKNWQSARSSIRKRAQQTYEISNKPKHCIKCGYNKYYEVCHIKSVSSFSDDTLISEINDINNLIALCPNCHWEFDNGLFDIS